MQQQQPIKSTRLCGDSMNPGDLLFISGTSWIAKAIMRITNSSYSHVAVYLGDGTVMEAQALQTVKPVSLTSYNGQCTVISLPDIVSPDQRQNGLIWLYNQRCRHYSYWSDFVILVRNLFGIMIPWHEGEDIICSRLARDFLFYCGLPIPDEDMSPEDVYEWLVDFTSHRMDDVVKSG